MSQIRNAIVFKASLPSVEALAAHLAEMPFKPIGETLVASHGFIPNSITAELVTPLEGGLSFTFRRDEKILPAVAVRAAIAEAVAAVEEEQDCVLEGDELGKLEEEIRSRLIGKALHGSRVVTCFYHTDSRILFVPTTNRRLANTALGALVQACGVVETSTIHISELKHGLTSRLRDYFEGELPDAFGGFRLGDAVLMKGKAGTVSVDLDNLDHARQAVIDALSLELSVERLQLVREQVAFKLTKEFRLCGITFLAEPTEEELEAQSDWDAAFRWRHERAVQMLQLVDVIEQLCLVFRYQENNPGPEKSAKGGSVEQGGKA